MDKKFDLTRRCALASIGASAVLAASPALAASVIIETSTTEAVAVVWPAYHRAGPERPHAGERVILRLENEPYMKPALAVYSQQGLPLGYVAPRKAEKLLSALDRGAKLDARIEATRAGTGEPGWHINTLSVSTVV